MVGRVGQQLGDYRLVAQLGQGSYAQVYLGQHIRLPLQAAVKVLHTHLTSSEAERFQHEAATIARLAHPSIVRVLDYDVQEGVAFLVMDYAPGGSLRRRYPKGSQVPLSQLIAAVKQVAAALQHAHEHKVIHRDVKPENMLLGKQQEVLLSDFGLATLAHSTSSLNRTGQGAAGTIAYMAPEQIEGHPCAASDQYALGVVVYEWLCGVRPFEGSMSEVLVQQLSLPPPPLRERVPTLPAMVERVVLQALAKDSEQRFASMYSFAVALEEAGMEDMSGQTLPMLTVQYSAETKRRGRSLHNLPTGTVTLLFTDIERSTQLLHQLDERYASVLSEYRQIMRSILHQFRGHEVDIQRDTFFAVFARATDAVSAAVEVQRALVSHSWPEGVTVRVRMGLHTGEPQLTVEDYIGLDVHHAAWIMAAAHGGQVLLSQTTRELVERDLPAEVYIRDLGVHRLKDLGRPERLFQLIISGVASDFPPLNTLDSHSNNLPIQPTPLIGREREVIAVGQLLQREEVHLVTLTGPGGIGKTRLSMQVAAELSDHFADGVFFVDLAPLSDPTFVVPTIAQTLGVREVVGRPMLQTVQERLRRWQVLLLLDNFEQVLSAAVQVADLLTACPQLKILVTSREVLHVRAEQEYVVPPLALPDTKQLPDLAALSYYAAVALFLQRAKAVNSDFQLTTDTALAIAEICVHLDGLPLAIELAAARIKLLSPQALLSRLSQRLQILTSGARDAPMRQQTLRNTIAWSYDLLKAEEQQLFSRLSVFIGGCTLEAVETICAARDDGGRAALDGVTSLIDKSLLQHTEQEGDETRLVMLETIHEYGLERLTASGEEESIRWAHADYYLALVEEAESHLKGAQQLLWLRRLDREQENLRVALSWLNAHEEAAKALRFCGALWLFWETRGYWSEGRRWLKAALALPGAEKRTVVRARALSAAGSLTGLVGELPEAHQLLSESKTLFKELGDEIGFVHALSIVGDMFLMKGDLDEAAQVLEECIALCRQLKSNRERSRALISFRNCSLF